MLSVLIPCYNYDASAILNSLYKQLKPLNFNYEILICDDHSPDESLKTINNKTAEQTNATYIQNQTNLGRTATRQKLAKQAKYERLLFMDVDVLPVKDNFIEKFNIGNTEYQVVFGGITYINEKPEKKEILRWTYGKSREAKTIQDRLMHPYLSIISQCFLINKDLFLKANSFLDNRYGVDVIFCYNLQTLGASVKHIDNPIIHLGLENNSAFIEKTLKGLKALLEFENKNLLPTNYKKIQKAYINLSQTGLIFLFMFFMKMIKPLVLKNLRGTKPSLLLFDLFRLHYFAKLKTHQTQNA